MPTASPLVVLVALAVFFLVLVALGSSPPAWFLAAAVAAGTLAAAFDARADVIPDALVVAVTVPIVAILVGEAAGGRLGPAAVSIGSGALLFAGPLLVLHLLAPAAMGFGDVKLASALGAGIGVVDARLALGALCLASAMTAGAGLLTRRRELPFGPGLVGGTLFVIVISTASSDGLLPWR
jgi:leader peptidase (prepilin peptidase)/N-methyltransferase